MEIQVQRMCLEARSVLCIQHLLPPKESHSWAHTCISIHTPNHTYFMLIKKPCCFNFLVETQCISSMMESTALNQVLSFFVFMISPLTCPDPDVFQMSDADQPMSEEKVVLF